MNTEKRRDQALERFYEQLQDTFSFQMHRVMKAFFRHTHAQAACCGYGLQIEHYPVIVTIDALKGISQQEIADILMRDKSSVQRTISLLQRKGLLHIEQDANDKRRNIVSLTEKGQDVARESRQLLRQADNSAFASFTVKERNEAIAAISQIADRLEAAAPPENTNS